MKNFNSIFNQLTAMPKRLAMVLTVLFTLGVGSMLGATTYNFSNIPTSGWSTSGNTVTINDKKWTYSSSTYIGCSDNEKIQVGSKNNPQTSNWTIQIPVSSFGTNIKVTKVAITAYTTVTTATYDISVGGSSVQSGSLATSSTTYTSGTLNATTGNIIVTLKGSSGSRAMYLSNISVTYETASQSYTITAKSNNTSYGSVSLTGTIITASPKTGYRVSTTNPYSISPSGSATVAQNGNTFTVTPSANTTITINFEAIPTHKVYFNTGGLVDIESVDVQEGATYNITQTPASSLTQECEYNTFVGWTKSNTIANPSSKPTIVNSIEMESSDITLYAVYSKTEGGGGSAAEQGTTMFSENWTGCGNNTQPTQPTTDGSVVYNVADIDYVWYTPSGGSKTQTYTSGGPNSNENILISKNNGYWKVVGIPTGQAETLTLSFSKSGSGVLSVSTSTSNVSISGSTITIGSSSVNTFDLIFTNTKSGDNLRLDDISVVVAKAGATGSTTYSLTPECATEATVTLDLDGGSFDSKPDGWEEDGNNYTKTVNSGDQVTLPEPNKTGHDFEGWYNASTKVTSPYTLTGNTTLTAHWTPQTYDVTYKDQGDVAFSGTHENNHPTQHTYGTATTLKSATKSGYNFLGWFTTSNCSGSAITQLGATAYTSNITLYAKWEEIPTTCTITYDANGGTGTVPTDNTEYTNGAIVTVKGNYGRLTKGGYAFTGWNTAADGSGTPYNAGDEFVITTNTTLYAQWCEAHWVLATDASKLENDTRIIIAAKDYNVALSTTQKTDNRGQTEIDKKYNTITTFSEYVQILTIEAGASNGTFAFNTGSGYLYAASSSANQLKTQANKGNADWTVSINDNSEARIVGEGMATHNVLRYNNTSQLFSCYLPTSNQKSISIYKEVCVQDQYNVNEPNLTNATAANTNPTTVDADATSLTLNYSANTGYLLPETITVQMGGATLVSGTDYTWDKETGELTITVTGFYGDIDVKIVAEEDPCYTFTMSEVTATSTTNSITLSWTALEGATSYNVTLNPGDFSVSTDKNSHTFEGLSPKTTYDWEVQAVSAICEDSKTGSTDTQKETFTVSWSVNGTVTSTESVVDGESIQDTPSTPSDQTLEDCGANKFMGWSEESAGSTPQDAAYYDDLCKAEDMIAKYPSITSNKTFYAVFATSGETTGGTVEATLSFANTAQRTSLTDDKAVWQQNNITLTNTKGTEQNAANCTTYVNPVRFYKYSKIKVEHTSDEISKILFTCNTSAYATALNTSIGTSNNVTVEVNDKEVVVTFNSPVEAFEVKLTDQVRMDALTVTAGGGIITTYSNYVTNCCATPVPTNGSYTSVSGTEIKLTWNGTVSRYHITCANPIIDDHTESTSYNVSSLTECEEYTFYVSADPKDGCESEAITITAQPFSGAKTVTFNYNGNGQANTTSSTSCGNTSITLPTPTWAGYRFMGWYTAANGGEKVNENPYTPTSDITLYAHWEKEYNVTYNANGGSTTCAGGAYIAGETVTVCTTDPNNTGHTFTGWTYSPNVTITDGKFVMPASDVTITAQWQVNSYTVTWNPNGGNWGGSTASIVETYEYGAAIVQPTAPQRDGYRFTGWNYSIPATMPAGNATYTAQWKQNYTITFYDGADVTPWTQTKDAESINLTEYVGTLACDDYQFAGWSTDATKYDDEPANITTWVTGTYTPTANIHLYAVYVKGDLATDFTLNCDGGVYEIWEKGHNQHMAGRQNGGGDKFYTTEYWDENNSESNGAPFTITKVADQTYTLQNADGQYITRDSYYEDELEIEETWENADRYKWTISNGTNGTWRFTNKAATSYALVYYNNRYFELRSASSVTAGNTTTYDLELTPAASNVYQSNPNCGPYYIIFNTHGGEFIQGEYAYGDEQTGLTETTYSKFPAAELEGYTFAGWKDGSPIDDEITSDNASDAPYLKQAGEDLVVSSNKTYHAVYYYYDEEEDIDFSKEFTTSIYAEVNGMKYFLSGTPSSGTMSSTTDCGYVSEVTITPGTGANAGKYKITVNGVAMAPKTNETDLLNGTYWWTITERSVGSGEYKISGQDRKNIVLFSSSWGHYTYNQGSEYGNNYYYPRFGKCLQHHWTSNPTLKPSLNLSGDVYVTATNARGIMATSTLKVSAKQLNANEKVNITSNSNDVYFSADRTVNFVKANKPTNTLTITASPSGVIEQEIYVHYKPSAEGNGTPASVVVSANLATPNPSVTDDQTIHVRNLPAKFVIATKVGATWYALPADMSSATNPLGVVIEVDETTMTTIAPNTITYTLWPVKTTATENDRYTNVTGAAYGDRVRFAAVNYEQRGLWANNNNNGSTIRNYAKIDALGADVLAGYEWKITTTVVDGHWQYTLQTDQTQNQNYLRYWTSAEGTPVGPKWGTYNAGENKLYFLPVTETQPFEYAVVEWYPTKVLIQTDAAITSPSVKVDGEAVASPVLTNKGGKLYEISNLPLETKPNKLLQISFTDNAINYTNTKVVPIILSRGAKTITGEPFATLTQKVYQYADVVVRDGATLSIDGTTDVANTLLGVTIYPTAKVSVAEGKKLSVHSLTFFGGIDEIYDGSTYKINKYGVPQLSLKGILNKTVTTIDYIMRVDLDQMYQVGVPYDVNLNEITYWDGSAIKLGDELYVSAYDGQARANLDMNNTWRWEVNFSEKVLKAGIGYTISAEPQVEGDAYSILRMPMESNISSGSTEGAKIINVVAYDNQKSVAITDNHKGWNYLSNPYMTAISGGEADTKLVLGYLKETGTGPWEWVNDEIRYVTIPHDDGEDYYQKKFSEAELKPFKSFFVQIAQGGELSFALASRQNAPARYMEVQTEQEVEFEILLSNDKQSDNTGLLIAEQYSPAYEINADLEKMIGSMSVYTIYGGYNLAYNALSPLNASEWIPMGYIAPAAGEYTFRLDDIDNIVEQVEHVYLIDYEANNIVDLMDDEYEFTTDKEQNNNRFAINIVLIQDKDNTTTGMDIINGNVAAPIKFIYHDKMYIQSGGVIYDGTGKQVTNINK